MGRGVSGCLRFRTSLPIVLTVGACEGNEAGKASGEKAEEREVARARLGGGHLGISFVCRVIIGLILLFKECLFRGW